MKKETKEFARLFGIALIVMLVVPLTYRVCIFFWPPNEKPRQTLTEFVEKAKSERCTKLLTKPIVKWTDAESKSEPEIHAWLKEQGNEILPWDWTEEARRKDRKGYAKSWLRIWKERKSHCEKVLAHHRQELKRLDRELQILTITHIHRTNQIARLQAIAATNAFPFSRLVSSIMPKASTSAESFMEVSPSMLKVKTLPSKNSGRHLICSGLKS